MYKRNKILKIGADINEMENRERIEKIIKTKDWFLQ